MEYTKKRVDQMNEAIDHLTAMFADISISLDDLESWKAEYESRRDKYPDWITRHGEHFKLRDINDEYLDNLIRFVSFKDPKNETKWIDVFNAEKRYRSVMIDIAKCKKELAYYERMINKIL